MNTLTPNEKVRLSQKKYYDNNKEKCSQIRLRRTYVKDFGNEYVDKLYEKYDGNMTKIQKTIKICRAYRLLNENGFNFNEGIDQFL
jgi:hypothetical protein